MSVVIVPVLSRFVAPAVELVEAISAAILGRSITRRPVGDHSKPPA
jgi:hypothetical protein